MLSFHSVFLMVGFLLQVGEELLKISSTSLPLVKTAKIILDEYFSTNSHNSNANRVMVARQPLFPNSSVEAIEAAEMSDGRSKQRRENFARTHSAKQDGKLNSSLTVSR